MESTETNSPLADALVKTGRISRENLQRALEEQAKGTLSLGIVLVKMGLLNEGVRLGLLKQKLGYDQLDFETDKVEAEAAQMAPRPFLEAQRLYPLRVDGKRLVVAMEDPSDEMLVEAIRHMTKLDVKPIVALSKDIDLLLRQGAPGAAREAERLRLERRQSAKGYRLFRAFFFPVVLFVPLVAFFVAAALIDPFQQALLSGDHSLVDIGIYVGLGWGLWAIVFYEVNVMLFKKDTDK